ncbi:MAG: prepilin-type N-terminal cleavage/methylation domain-containing protein [Phycisphaeraceae bacterium]|nr:prepilin-type N-terminal cleavage/methylation domain-containing protein [Phycisphaeraceae bacterium]
MTDRVVSIAFRTTPRNFDRAFTLVEVVIVITISIVLVSLLMPALSEARERGRGIVCASKMRHLHAVAVSYGHDQKAVLSGVYFENMYSAYVAGRNDPMWYRRVFQPWFVGPATVVLGMKQGYLPRNKNVAWCDSMTMESSYAQDYWGDVTYPFDTWRWCMVGSPYAWNGYGLDSLRVITSNWGPGIYRCGGGIPLALWDTANQAFFITESEHNVRISDPGLLDGVQTRRMARHLGSLNVQFVDGHLQLIPRDDLFVKMTDKTFNALIW